MGNVQSLKEDGCVAESVAHLRYYLLHLRLLPRELLSTIVYICVSGARARQAGVGRGQH